MTDIDKVISVGASSLRAVGPSGPEAACDKIRQKEWEEKEYGKSSRGLCHQDQFD